MQNKDSNNNEDGKNGAFEVEDKSSEWPKWTFANGRNGRTFFFQKVLKNLIQDRT